MKKKWLEIFRTLKQNTTSLLRNTENESYQQGMFHNLQTSSSQIVQALLLIADRKIQTNIFDNLVENYQRYSTCVITYCPHIVEMAKDSSFFTLSHKHHYSQSILLALYLTKQANVNVKLFISDESFLGVSHMLANQKQIDKITFVKDSLIKEGVQVHNILSWNNQDIQLISEDIVVIDLFNLNPAQYLPFILKNYQRIRKSSKAYVYHSNLQDFYVGQLLNQLNNNTQFDILPLQLWPSHPYSIQFLKYQIAMELKLIEFLQKDSVYPQKQDIVIFYPLRISLFKYTIRLRQILAKYNLKDQVNIINNRTAHQLKSKNNIFVVKDSTQLTTWNYNFSDVLYVIDYGTQSHFTFDYKYQCFVQSIRQVSITERAKRIAWVGADRIGCYFSLRQTNSVENVHYADEVQQLSLFLIKMIDYGLSNEIDKTNSRISSCLSLLQATKIIKNQNNTYQILDERVITYGKQGVLPFFSKLLLNVMDDSLLSTQEKRRTMNLLIMIIVVFKKQGDLRVINQEIQDNHIKPYPVWRKSGYLESCLEILTKSDLIQLRGKQSQSKSQSFRRQTSKISQRVNSKLRSNFEQDLSKRKRFEQMQIQDLIKEYTINEQLFYTVREEIDFFRQVFNVAPMGILLQKQDVYKAIKYILKIYSKGVAFFVGGLKDKEYFIGDDTLNVDKLSLLNYSNILPKIIVLLRLESSYGRKDILLANSVSEEAYLSEFGCLPSLKQIIHDNTADIKDEIVRTESQKIYAKNSKIEFNSIPSSIIEQFLKDNGILIDYFQEENNCEIQILYQQGIITLFYADQQQKIREQFTNLLKELKQTIRQYIKVVPYLGCTNFCLGAGGIAKQLIKTEPVLRCIIENLPIAACKQDLINLFSTFKLKKIQILQPKEEEQQKAKSAVVTFHSPKQYSKFYHAYHKSEFLGMNITVNPFKNESSDIQQRQKCNYIQFKWYIWRSHCKALIQFTSKEGADKAFLDFTQIPEFDGTKVVASLVDQKSLFLDYLNQFTDEIYIKQAVKNYGQIKTVEILKTPLKQVSGEDKHLSYLIRTVFGEKQEINVKLGSIEKQAQGLRICRGYCSNIEHINKISQELNNTVNKIGQGRLYAQTWFQIPILVPSDSMAIYQQLLQQTIALFPERPNIQSTIEHQNDKIYIILRSCIKEVVDLVHQKLSEFLQGHPIQLPDQAKNVVLNDVGLANLLDLEEKYQCRMIINAQTQGLNVLISSKHLKKVKEEIKLKINDHFFYSIPINKKIYKLYLSEPEKLQEIKLANHLRTLQLQQDSYALLMEGSAINIQKTTNIYAIESKPATEVVQKRAIAAQICGICYDQAQQSFTLFCKHKFCKQCLLQFVQFSLRDASLFPLKCPHSECRNLIAAADLDFLLDGDDWRRLMVFASNKFVFEHEDLIFCMTAGCAQINQVRSMYCRIKTQYFNCQLCDSGFCLRCKRAYHPSRPCHDLQSEQLFKQYIKQNGVRICANPRCRVPVVRWTGCFKVHCTRCDICMCFKCPPDQMTPYQNQSQCYRHLTEVHGGYF